ncbi:hypothetical protein BU25DRAFT_151209 [Macroventuria anomochaeta]|uniref:Uncharacterized protein n=1 Tax=Macroventuria anomochaeta TaxID=301207 RepID=A0ACB6SDN0_9PLEO|nr:uncharacterized protein BU25DRAFT_151209 [Macroventuria anomochaeta]KAF2632421.1 hypothetical protein BU25DRAFT_151209 [Macroventuria anomochaeta]
MNTITSATARPIYLCDQLISCHKLVSMSNPTPKARWSPPICSCIVRLEQHDRKVTTAITVFTFAQLTSVVSLLCFHSCGSIGELLRFSTCLKRKNHFHVSSQFRFRLLTATSSFADSAFRAFTS